MSGSAGDLRREPDTVADGPANRTGITEDVESQPRPEVRSRQEVRPRSELEIRWRQARNPPPPVVRAVVANIAVAAVGGVALLLVDWLASQGVLPEAWASVAPLAYVAIVIISGSLLTYLWVEMPTGREGERRRSGWSAVLGFFASIPIVYLALVLVFQVIRPLLP